MYLKGAKNFNSFHFIEKSITATVQGFPEAKNELWGVPVLDDSRMYIIIKCKICQVYIVKRVLKNQHSPFYYLVIRSISNSFVTSLISQSVGSLSSGNSKSLILEESSETVLFIKSAFLSSSVFLTSSYILM